MAEEKADRAEHKRWREIKEEGGENGREGGESGRSLYKRCTNNVQTQYSGTDQQATVHGRDEPTASLARPASKLVRPCFVQLLLAHARPCGHEMVTVCWLREMCAVRPLRVCPREPLD